MKWKFIFTLLTFTIVCSESCNNCEKLELTQPERDWINQFKTGESSLFKNAKGQVDTLEVTNVEDSYSPCNKFELSKFRHEKYFALFKFRSISKYNDIESSITMTTEEWKKRIPYIYLGNIGLYRDDLANKMPGIKDTILSGIKLDSIYCYTLGLNTEEYGETKFFKSFFWNKRYGLMAYTTADSSLFVRINTFH